MGDPLRDNSAESLMGRLNQIDVRLRQLEEKETVPESYFTEDLRATGKPVSSVLEDVQLKNTLMSRLNLLEARIRQLSDGLDKGGSTGCSSRDLCSSSNTMLVKQVMNEGEGITYPAENQKLMRSNIGSRGLRGTWRAGADIFQSHGSKKKAKDPMNADTTEAMEKSTAAFCRNEKRRMEHTRLYRRWFPLGC